MAKSPSGLTGSFCSLSSRLSRHLDSLQMSSSGGKYLGLG